MKIKRLMAALLCSAMVMTSQSVSVFATETLAEIPVSGDSELSVEASDETVLINENNETTVDQLAEEPGTEKKLDESTDLSENEVLKDDGADILLQDDQSDADKMAVEETAEGSLEKFEGSAAMESSAPVIENEGAASEFLTVDPDGKLTLRGGYSSLRETGAKSVTIPKETKKIEDLETLFVNNNVIETVTFEAGSNIDEIDIVAGAFANSSIKIFSAPDNYVEIKGGTFQNCTELVQFNFNNVEIIGANAFNGCTSFGSQPELLDGEGLVKSIGDYAFSGTGFKTLNFSSPKLVSSTEVTIGVGAFSKCTNLETAYVPKSFNGIPASCFSGCNKLKKVVVNCAGIVDVRAFENCSVLTDIDLGKVTTIKEYAFNRCVSLKSIILPATVVMVEAYAFDGCDSLVSATFLYKGPNGNVDKEIVKPKAFPYPEKTTLSGYGGKLKEYANTNKFKEFKSLSEDRTIKVSKYLATYYTVSVSIPGKSAQSIITSEKTKDDKGWYAIAKPGDEVTITLYSRKKGYDMVRNSLSDGSDTEFNFVSYESYIYKYSCTMPEHDMVLNLETYTHEDLNKGNMKYSIAGKNNATFVSGGGASPAYYSIDNGAGKKGQLYINTPSGKGILPEMFTYKSSNTNVATISNTGLITVLKDGETTITAVYKQNTGKKISFVLYSNGNIGLDADSLGLTFDSTEGPIPTITKEKLSIDGKEKEVWVVTYDKSAFNTSEQTFKVKLSARNKDGEKIYVNAKWNSGDTKIAKVASAENMDNANTVTVLRNAIGETNVRAAVLTDEKDENGKKITAYVYLIIRIKDTMPKVVENNIKLNIRKNKEDEFGGAGITLVPVVGYPIKGELISKGGAVYESLYQLKSAGNYTEMDGFKLLYAGENTYHQHIYRIIPTGAASTRIEGFKSTVFDGNNKLYVRCANKGGDYYIPINKVTVVDEKLEFKIKPTGSINLFYNSKCYDPYAYGYDPETDLERKKGESEPDYLERYITATVGTVEFSNPVATSLAELDHVELVDYPHYREYSTNEAYKPAAPDKLKNNFVIAKLPNGKDFVIMRSGNSLKQEDGKDVTTGYLFFWFRGVKNPAIVPLTIPTKSAAPGYTLTPGSATDNVRNITNAEFDLKVINKSSKKVMIRKDTLASLELSGTNAQYYFEALNNGSMDMEGVITLKRKAVAMPEDKMTVPIAVKRVNWEKKATYNFSLSINDKDPKIKLSPTSVKLDNKMAGDSDRMVLSSDQTNTIIGIAAAPEYTGKGTAPAIVFSYETATDGSYVIIPKLNGDVKKGSYKYRVTPTFKYKASSASPRKAEKPVNFSVNVIDTQPSMKLSSTNFTFNVEYPNAENITSLVTIGSVKVPEDTTIDVSNARLVPQKPDALSNEIAQKVAITTSYNTEKKKNEITLKLAELSYPTKFSYTYNLTNVKVKGAEIKPVKVTVKGVTAYPSITLKPTGALNIVDRSTEIKYKATIKNLSNPEIGDSITVYEYEDGKRVVSKRFMAARDAADPTVTHLYARHDDESIVFENKQYDLQLSYSVSGISITTGVVKVKPSQTLPKYSISPDNIQFVSAMDKTQSGNRQTAMVYLTKTSLLQSHVTNIKLASNNSDIIKNAFKVTYVDGDKRDYISKSDKTCYAGYVVVTCMAPELLTKGVNYNLILEAELEGQFQKKNSKGVYEKVNGPKITVPVMVNK